MRPLGLTDPTVQQRRATGPARIATSLPWGGCHLTPWLSLRLSTPLYVSLLPHEYPGLDIGCRRGRLGRGNAQVWLGLSGPSSSLIDSSMRCVSCTARIVILLRRSQSITIFNLSLLPFRRPLIFSEATLIPGLGWGSVLLVFIGLVVWELRGSSSEGEARASLSLSCSLADSLGLSIVPTKRSLNGSVSSSSEPPPGTCASSASGETFVGVSHTVAGTANPARPFPVRGFPDRA